MYNNQIFKTMRLLNVYTNPAGQLGWLLLLLLSLWGHAITAQQLQSNSLIPDLSKINETDAWTIYNREVKFEQNQVYIAAGPDAGLAWLNNVKFSNGTISFRVRGKDDAGKSFVGLAFHGENDSTYEVVYFRPFNFRNPERKKHSVQYMYLPEYSWDKLRENDPGKYENAIADAPHPDDWFLVRIEVAHPLVQVFVNGAKEPSLEITQLSSKKAGRLGLWVGNNSEGYFKDLKIIPLK